MVGGMCFIITNLMGQIKGTETHEIKGLKYPDEAVSKLGDLNGFSAVTHSTPSSGIK
jgi:hypothetical protein